MLPPSPTRQATAASLTSHVPPVQRASGGAGRGAVTPPPGDAARGWAVFVNYLPESVLNPNALIVDGPGCIASSASTVNQGGRWSAKPAELVKR